MVKNTVNSLINKIIFLSVMSCVTLLLGCDSSNIPQNKESSQISDLESGVVEDLNEEGLPENYTSNQIFFGENQITQNDNNKIFHTLAYATTDGLSSRNVTYSVILKNNSVSGNKILNNNGNFADTNNEIFNKDINKTSICKSPNKKELSEKLINYKFEDYYIQKSYFSEKKYLDEYIKSENIKNDFKLLINEEYEKAKQKGKALRSYKNKQFKNINKEYEKIEVGHRRQLNLMRENSQLLYEKAWVTCQFISDSAYYYVNDKITIPKNIMESIVTAFEDGEKIVNHYFGNNHDTDGNGKIIVVLTPMEENLLGYFSPSDKFQMVGGSLSNSNEGDFLYVNGRYMVSDEQYEKYKDDINSTFVHEYQHMVLYDYRKYDLGLNPDIDLWINEGLSMLAENFAGYVSPHSRYIRDLFLYGRGRSLINFNQSIENKSIGNYGYSLLFFLYLNEVYGHRFIEKIYNSKETGYKIVEEITGKNFNTVFKDFIYSIFLTGRKVTKNKFYNIPAFNYTMKNSIGYKKMGFNLSQVIDEVYNTFNQEGIRCVLDNEVYNNTLGVSSFKVYSYGFHITKWYQQQINSLNIVNSNVTNSVGINFLYDYFHNQVPHVIYEEK